MCLGREGLVGFEVELCECWVVIVVEVLSLLVGFQVKVENC